MKELQDFADAFTNLVEVITAGEPDIIADVQDLYDAQVRDLEDPVPALKQRVLALEVRLGEIHRLVDQHDTRLDNHMGRISELEILTMHNGKATHE
jgi:hypothetical protein